MMNFLDELTDTAVTVCDKNAKIIYMNESSVKILGHGVDRTGQSLYDCHNERSCQMIRHMLETGEPNHYTISKNGRRKIVHQLPWREGGEIAGLVEFSMFIPDDLPHYQR